jgi:NADH-quinone oxidoreductase subunit C
MSNQEKPFSEMTEEEKAEAKRKAVEEAKRKAAEKKAAKEAAESSEAPAEKPFSEMTEEEKAEAKRKAVEEAKRKAAERKAAKEAEESPVENEAPADDKAKAAAAAKAKAAAAAKAKASGGASDDEKAKAVAAAKAKAAAAAKAKATKSGGNADDEKAKAIAAAKAKAAAAAKAKQTTGSKKEEDPVEEKPSLKQPLLDKYVKVIKENLGDDILEDSYINRLAKDVPTLIAKHENYYKLAEFMKYNEQLCFEYVSESHGTDFETHMEVYTHMFSFKNNQPVALKVKVDRDRPEVASLTPLWAGANWPEREAYDLLGIHFTGHPNLTRIMMPDDWVGYPMRKDYEPYDVEV